VCAHVHVLLEDVRVLVSVYVRVFVCMLVYVCAHLCAIHRVTLS
jgi:hypothetical protein